MLSHRWTAACVLLTALFSAQACGTASAGRGIEAIEGKRYHLTRDHGPWMIMVATFHTIGRYGDPDVGKTPEEAADELVFELRQKGIPAYVYSLEAPQETVLSVDKQGREVRRKTLRKVNSIGVLAGNYSGTNDKTARATLDWIKRYDPECLKEGVVFNKSEKRKTPLAGAFLTMNPQMTPEEVEAHKELDPVVLRLNHRERNSLLENDGRYTLVVATFGGKSTVADAKIDDRSDKPLFSLKNELSLDSDLDYAALEARGLAEALRVVENVEAYVWHDRYQSIVTVGSFNGPNDPEIARYRQRFAADEEIDALLPVFATSVKTLAIDGRGNKVPQRTDVANGAAVTPTLPDGFRIWAFDPNPRLMAVPRQRR
ncbi:MAG: hypothetical protein DWQ34_15615 [Planctomycetota bacterium]|nr:MAG: hypothetical protein DWQ29_19830 [Planctomycetota bacterium]REJ91167.1 MAG: hypothetical protein DWQ34_15615 [Planctomycetota bacterium]REK20355.1 MAG: hypothetical protein DWQ41_25545 [Planctomycetota bacterium]REK26852.1 MAG: hypothetical protein DWQ45_26845 [Planctomycetota bacterium]